MNNAMKSKLNLLVATCALLVSVTQAQSESVFERPLTLAPADAAASGGGGAGDDAKANAAALAKTLANPIGALISVPFQNNFDFGGGPDGDGFQYKLNLPATRAHATHPFQSSPKKPHHAASADPHTKDLPVR